MDGKNTQLVSIRIDGEVSTVRRGRDKGLDIRDLGDPHELRVERVSEILWDAGLAGFRVELLPVLGKRHPLTVHMLHEAGMRLCCLTDKGIAAYSIGETLYFHDYEDAVSAEVLYLEAAKKCGGSVVW